MSMPPPAPNTIRILHTSDWQLGMNRSFLNEEAQHRFVQARIEAVERVLEMANNHHCDAIVVAGDAFDSNLLKPATYHRTLEILQQTTIPTFILPGNHDPLDETSPYHSNDIAAMEHVHILHDHSLHEVNCGPNRPKLRIIGAPWFSKRPGTEPTVRALQELPPAKPTDITVLVGHGATQSFGDALQFHIDLQQIATAIEQRTLDYLALGDTHSAMPVMEHNRSWYSGSPEVTDYVDQQGKGEKNSGKALVVDINVDHDATSNTNHSEDTTTAVHVQEIPIGTWAFLAMDHELTARRDAEQFIEALRAIPNKHRTAVKYALTGTLNLEADAWLQEQLEQLSHNFAALYPRTSRSEYVVLPDAEDLATGMFPEGIIRNTVDRLVEQTNQQDLVASDALALLYRLDNTIRDEDTRTVQHGGTQA